MGVLVEERWQIQYRDARRAWQRGPLCWAPWGEKGEYGTMTQSRILLQLASRWLNIYRYGIKAGR